MLPPDFSRIWLHIRTASKFNVPKMIPPRTLERVVNENILAGRDEKLVSDVVFETTVYVEEWFINEFVWGR